MAEYHKNVIISKNFIGGVTRDSGNGGSVIGMSSPAADYCVKKAKDCLRNIRHLPRARRYAEINAGKYETFREEWAAFMSEYTR